MENITDEHKKKVTDLANKGFECLEDGDYETALDIAKQLEELRYSAAFEITAQAYAGMGEIDNAVKALERGVEIAPESWVNWQLLGNYSSDQGNYDRAKEAYEQALACQGVWEDSIRLNQAVLSHRCNDYESSLGYLEKITDSLLTLPVAEVRTDVFRGMGRLDEALTLADSVLAKEWDNENADESLARIAASRGRICLDKATPTDNVRHSAMEAIEDYGPGDMLLALIRDIDNTYSKKAKYFRLAIHGTISEESPYHDEVAGYYVKYDVVAETAEQAFKTAQQFEKLCSTPASLHLEDSELLEKCPDQPLGVYWRSGRFYYEHEDD